MRSSISCYCVSERNPDLGILFAIFLVVLFASHSSGTMADLPFQLKKGLDGSLHWETSGEPRVDEKTDSGEVNVVPHISQLGHGMVYSFAGATDGGLASAFCPEFSDEGDTTSDPGREESVHKHTRDGRKSGGGFTTAFERSVLACGSGSIRDGVLTVQKQVKRNNENLKKVLKAVDKSEREQHGHSDIWEKRKKSCDQEPSFGSSHFTRLDFALFM